MGSHTMSLDLDSIDQMMSVEFSLLFQRIANQSISPAREELASFLAGPVDRNTL